MSPKKQKLLNLVLVVLLFVVLLYAFSGKIMSSIGEFLIVNEEPVHSDAVVVLFTGVQWYPRLMEAAGVYREGFANKVVINGNRKTEVLRRLEEKGFQACCPWYEDAVRILSLLGVPREDVIAVSVEDAYDTVSEAKTVGKALIEAGVTSIIITTSKFHTRRARYIWKSIFQDQFIIRAVSARSDSYSPKDWWKEGRQVRWVLSEYGAWIYYFWKTKVLADSNGTY